MLHVAKSHAHFSTELERNMTVEDYPPQYSDLFPNPPEYFELFPISSTIATVEQLSAEPLSGQQSEAEPLSGQQSEEGLQWSTEGQQEYTHVNYYIVKDSCVEIATIFLAFLIIVIIFCLFYYYKYIHEVFCFISFSVL